MLNPRYSRLYPRSTECLALSFADGLDSVCHFDMSVAAANGDGGAVAVGVLALVGPVREGLGVLNPC